MFKSILQHPKLETSTTAELTPSGELTQLRVDVRNGSVRIHQWEHHHIEAKVHVLATGAYAEELRESGTDVCWSLEQKGQEAVFQQQTSTSFVQLIGMRMGGLAVDVELYVPQGLSAKLESHNGKIAAEQYEGNIRAVTHNGDINMRQMTGNLELETHNGHVEAEQVDGELEAMTHNGSLRIERVTGRVQAESHNGRIRARDCLQQLRLMSHRGDIRVIMTEPLTANWDIQTKQGAIEAEIPRDTKVSLDLQTKLGKISGSAVPAQVSGISQHLKTEQGSEAPLIFMESKLGKVQLDTFR